ncbi:MAG: ferredoxin [Methanosphaera sp.]|nr:ferredoxin [Methanosphaera sp.]
MYEVILERDDCMMCGHCVEVDDSLFAFDQEDDLATLIGSTREDDIDEIEVDDVEVYKEAADLCTGECIEVFDDEGNPV